MTVTPTPERPNIRHVAAVAGVSHMTVSRVLNNHPNIKPETRQRVLDAIEETGFRPNSAARALANQRNRRIGVLVEASDTWGPSTALRGIELAAGGQGYSVTSVSLRSDEEGTTQAAVDQLKDQGIDALCVIAPRSASLSELRQLNVGLPVLAVKGGGDPTFYTAAVDQRQGTALLVDHLAELGHRSVLHVSGPLDWFDARDRERAFYARSREWQLREQPVVVGDWTADFAYDYAVSLKRKPEYTAVFAANDEMALGVMHACWERGIEVPRELSVVGFDDIPMAAHFAPPLTTIRQDFRYAAERAMDILLAALDRKAPPAHDALSVELIQRHSTAAPRRDTLTK